MSDINNMDELMEGMELDLVEDDGSLLGQVINLVLEDDTEMETLVVAAFEMDDYPYTYVALLPIVEDAEDDEEQEVFLYRFDTEEDGTPILTSLESEEEYEAASEKFYEELDAMAEEEDDEEE